MNNATKISLVCNQRDLSGTSNSRRLRHTDAIPAILYGGSAQPELLSIQGKDWRKISTVDEIYTSIFDLDIAGSKKAVILKSVQRHPTDKLPLHVDFFRADSANATERKLPVKLLNEELCAGVKQGGIIIRQLNEIIVKGKLADLPAFIEIDMEEVLVSQAIRLSDLKLPASTTIPSLIRGIDQMIVSVTSKRGAQIAALKAMGDMGDDEEAGAIEQAPAE